MGYPEAIRLLVELDADVNARGNRGSTPLNKVASRGIPEVVLDLIEKVPT